MAKDAIALQQEYSEIFAKGMALEDRLLEEGKLNEFAHRSRDMTDWLCRTCTIIQDGDKQRCVTQTIIDVVGPNGPVIIPAGMDYEAAARKFLEAKPHWGKLEAPGDLAEQAFGPTPSLKAQKMFLETECLGNVETANSEAKKWGTSLGSLKPGTRPGKEAAPKKPAAEAISKNPWLLPDGPEATERRVGIIKRLGTTVAASLAKSAGKTIAGTPLRGA